MTEIRYCILCGNSFESDDPDTIFCRLHREVSPDESNNQDRDLPSQNLKGQPPVDNIDKSVNAPSDWKPGDTILDTYKVKGILGQGGFGKVYRVHHKFWNIDLAVKRALILEEESKQGFIDEAQHWIDLGLHPHIISCYYVRNINGFPHTFAELAEGGSLHNWIQRKSYDLYEGTRDQVLQRILDITIQFAWGLAYAHQHGLVHQDIKPQNALMTPDGILKVTDFGLTKARGSSQVSSHQTEKGDLLVSGGAYDPYHCSPEQASSRKLSLKTDIWSWAVSILEMFNGGVSWVGGQAANFSLESYLTRVGEGRDIPRMPKELADLLRLCLQPNPNNRLSDMQAIAKQLLVIYQQAVGKPYPRQMPQAAELRADSLNNKALSLLDLGKPDQVEACWKAALQADSFHLQATYNYGVWQWRHALLTDEALLEQLNRAGSAHPESGASITLNSLVHLERGDQKTSKLLLEKAKKISPKEIHLADLVTHINENKGSECLQSLKTGSVSSMAVSRDGWTLATSCQANQLSVWDLASNSCKMHSRGFIESELPVVAVSSNGQWIVEGGFQILRVWDRNNSSSKSFDIFDVSPRSLAISSDDENLICGFDDGSVILYDPHSREFSDELPYHRAETRAVSFSPDDELIISGGDYGKIIVWSMKDRVTLAEFEGQPVWSLAVSWNGEEVFAACRDGNIYQWNTRKKELIRKLSGHREEVRSVALSPDGKLLLSGSDDTTVRVWDAKSGRCLFTSHEHEGAVTGVWLQKDGPIGYRAVTASEGDGVRIWRIADHYPPICPPMISQPSGAQETVSRTRQVVDLKQKIKEELKNGQIFQARDLLISARKTPGFENDKDLVDLSYEIGGRLGRYRAFLGARQLKPVKDQVELTDQLALTPDGRFLISDARDPTVWDFHTRSFLSTIQKASYPRTPPRPFVISPDGRHLALIKDVHSPLSYSGSQIGLWDLEKCQWSQTFTSSARSVDVQFHPDGTRLISLHREAERSSCQVSVWDITNSKALFTIPCGNDASRIQVSKNGRFVLAATNHEDSDCSVSVISLDEGRQIHLFSGLGAPFLISPDSTLAAAYGQGGMVLFDLPTCQEKMAVKEFSIDCSRLTFFAFSHDGSYLLGPHNNNIGVFSVRTGSMHNTLETPGWDSGILCLQLGCKDGWVFASGDKDYNRGEIALWQIDSSKPVHIFKGFGFSLSIGLCQQDRYLIGQRENQYPIYELDWEHEFPDLSDWDKCAKGYLEVFIGQNGGKASWLEICEKDPVLAQEQFSGLMAELERRGFGWLREEGVRDKLGEMAST